MRFKANKDQLEAVVKMLGMMLDSFPAETIEEEVFEEIVNKIFIRLQAKSLQIYCNKNSWAFSLNAIEAKCIHIFCKNTYLDEVNYHYEAHQLRKIFNEIDKIYGRIKAKIAQTEASLRNHPYTDWIARHDKITELKEQLKQKNMNTATLSKPANELSAAELKALLADRESEEQNQRIQKRKDYEVLRDSTVNELVGGAMHFNGVLKGFKTNAYNDLEAMYKLLQEHSSRHEKGKGTFTIENSESTMKVQFKRHDATMFDERATQAEKYILEFLTDEFGDDSESDPRNKLIKKLLERKRVKVDKDNVLLLAGMKDDFPNANWHKGIDLYLESIVPAHTKYYAQFYYRNSVDDAWLSIVLDFAKL